MNSTFSNRNARLGALAFALLTMVGAGTALAQSETEEAELPPPIREPLPPKVSDNDGQIQPEVRIRQEDDRTVEEYVSNGRVYMVRITPIAGPSYYMIDTTGDGLLDLRHDRLDPVKPVYWKLIEW